MTLIITDISKFGIAMVADSAVTTTVIFPSGDKYIRVLNGSRKLQVIPYLSAGISTFGLGFIGGVPTDIWLTDFIQRNSDITSIDDFANVLSVELQKVVGKVQEHLGFHLAGYVDHEGQRLPTFYCVRNVDGTYGNYGYHDFVPGHDFTPNMFTENRWQVYRNGDFGAYAVCEEKLRTEIFPGLALELGINIPHPSLQGWITYHMAWVKFMSDLYASFGKNRSIGGPIIGLGITKEGQLFQMNG